MTSAFAVDQFFPGEVRAFLSLGSDMHLVCRRVFFLLLAVAETDAASNRPPPLHGRERGRKETFSVDFDFFRLIGLGFPQAREKKEEKKRRNRTHSFTHVYA